jgi:uncharacterized protein YjbJ (UPF0337 family)
MGELIDKVGGKIKQAAGMESGDKKLEREGKKTKTESAMGTAR